jgi:uncharacterized protein
MSDTLPPPAPGELSVGLISDTHGWLDPAVHQHFAGVAHVVHAGDVGGEDVLIELATIAPVTAVRGNIDGRALARLPLTGLVEVAGIRLAVLHIAGQPTRPDAEARDLVERVRPDVLVVGHSHIPVAGRILGTLWINPGAAGHQGFHQRRTVAMLRIAPGGRLQLYQIDLGPRGTAR